MFHSIGTIWNFVITFICSVQCFWLNTSKSLLSDNFPVSPSITHPPFRFQFCRSLNSKCGAIFDLSRIRKVQVSSWLATLLWKQSPHHQDANSDLMSKGKSLILVVACLPAARWLSRSYEHTLFTVRLFDLEENKITWNVSDICVSYAIYMFFSLTIFPFFLTLWFLIREEI